MKRWIIIGSVAFVAVVLLMTLVLVLMNRGGSDELATVSEVTEEWKTIEHPTYGVSFQVPIALDVSVIDDGLGSVAGSLIDGNTVVTLDIYTTENNEGLSANQLLRSGVNWSTSEIKVGKYEGIKYVGRELVGDVHDEGDEAEDYILPDSYVVGLKLLRGGTVLTAKCSVVGFDYAEYISVCDRIIDSIKAI